MPATNTFREGYAIRNQFAAQFLTFTICGWIDLFTRKIYRNQFLESIRYCQREKQLAIHAYVIMSNHIHMVVTAKDFAERHSTRLQEVYPWGIYNRH